MSNMLEICEKCGWHKNYQHNKKRYNMYDACDPKKGEIAAALSAAVPSARSTKLGYGAGNLTFEISEDVHVTFRVHSDETFGVGNVFLAGDLNQERAARLVRVLQAWAKEDLP